MGFFGSSDSETRWSSQIDEFEYDVDAAYDLAKDTLEEIGRLKASAGRLRGVADQYEGSDVLATLANKFDSVIRHDIGDVVRDLQRAADTAQHLGAVVDSM